MSIKAIFFSKFDTQEGPKVVHQVPDGAIASTTSPSSSPLVDFSSISSFVIPRQELCGNLIQFCIDGYRIMGYPVCIPSPRYDRNEFIFNFSIVLTEDEEFSTYKSVVQKLADLMKGLEEQSGFLSRDYSKGGEGKVYALCEMLMEDLNNYCECMIPIDDLNTLNIKLFPTYPPPPPVKSWHVPLFTVRPETLMDENWDITMQRIVPHINGISSVYQIALLADADLALTRRCIKHLLYYGCLLLLDIFSFSAIYAPTAQFASTIASDEAMQRECARYVNTAFAPQATSTHSPSAVATHSGVLAQKEVDVWPAYEGEEEQTTVGTGKVVDGIGIVELFAALRQGLSVRQWCREHSAQLANIDVRRLVTFGIIKGFLYRVHKYAFATGIPSLHAAASVAPREARNGYGGTAGSFDAMTMATAGSGSGQAELHSTETEGAEDEEIDGDDGAASGEDGIDDRMLARYIDGTHCFDQICTELEISERELTARLRRWPMEVQIIHR